MSYEKTGMIESLLPVEHIGQAGVAKQVAVISWVDTYQDREYPKKCAFSFYGKAADKLQPYREGATVKVRFDVESREYNGKFYTECKAFDIVNA
jgi:hypothetical protein